MIAGTTPKVQCRHCSLKVYPGNLDRHLRKCRRTAKERQLMAFLAQMRKAARKAEGAS